jgi:putative tryptophan/tyrosine transport system substrate-binding protein
MRRRELIAALGGAAAAWPLVARAQQARHVPIIGYVAPSNPLIPSRSTGAFLQRLREVGWIEGQTITIETRWAAGRPERLDEIAAEFIRLKVDLIVTSSTNDSIVMKRVAPCLRPSQRTSFHHQPEAQHPKSSAIHKLGRPITPSFVPLLGDKRT